MNLAARVKPAYGPTLPELVQARLGGVPRPARLGAAALLVVIVAVGALATLRGGSSTASGSSGGVSFSFNYSGLRRQPTPAGATLLLAARRGSRLIAELAVAPLRLPAYRGEATGIEPVIAANYMRVLAAHTAGVVLENTGPTIVNGTAGYNFTYTRAIAGETYFGRVIFLTPSLTAAHGGVIISLLAQPVLAGIIGSGKSNLAAALYEPGQGGVGVLFQPAGLLSQPLATFKLSG